MPIVAQHHVDKPEVPNVGAWAAPRVRGCKGKFSHCKPHNRLEDLPVDGEDNKPRNRLVDVGGEQTVIMLRKSDFSFRNERGTYAPRGHRRMRHPASIAKYFSSTMRWTSNANMVQQCT